MIIKNGLSSFQTHALRIGRPCFGVTSWCFFFFRFSRCMVTFLRNLLNFQNTFVLDKHQYDFCFCTKSWIPKNPCEHGWSCIVLEEKGNTPKDSWRNGFIIKGYAQCVICMKQQQKMKTCHEHGKNNILLIRKTHLTEKSLATLWAYEQN